MQRSGNKKAIQRVAQCIADADAILVGAGAGMGVDSGLPDFRGNEGFWRAYPRFAHLGLSFTDLANPRWFFDDPCQAWGFYGHRYNLYRATRPHEGFFTLRRWMRDSPLGGFVFTSNVDGHFQRAGIAGEQVMECHGSINYLQCLRQCSRDIWPADIVLDVDEVLLKARGELPRCIHCGGMARPNVLMFGDFGWTPDRCDMQQHRYQRWLEIIRKQSASLVVIELGAGVAVPTVRYECEYQQANMGDATMGDATMGDATLIRINPRDIQAPEDAIVIQGNAAESLQKIADCLARD